MSTTESDVHEKREAVHLPMWKEAAAGLEWLALQASPVYYGAGVPHGHGDPVILVPGFLLGDYYLREMHRWLKRIGYQPYHSGIGLNANCPFILMNKLTETLRKAFDETGHKVHLIGHSLGGMIARSEAVRHPEWVASVTTMASPFQGMRAHPNILFLGELVKAKVARQTNYDIPPDCFTGRCQCDFVTGLRKPIPETIPQTAIYTKTDGIVSWDVCVTGDPAIDVEVRGTHTGLAFNTSAYRTIADRLSRFA